MIHQRVTYQEIQYAFHHPNKKIKCLLLTYYGRHDVDSKFNYAYKTEYIPLES